MATTNNQTDSGAIRGLLFGVIAAMLWATAGLSVKMAATEIPSPAIVWYGRWIGLIAFSPVLFLNIRQKGLRVIKPRRPLLLVLRALASLGASYCLFYALSYLTLTSAILLSYTRPLWLPLVVLLIYRKRLEPVIWFALIMGFVGVLLILEPSIDLTHPAALVGLASGLIGAIAMLLIRRLAKVEASDSITFHYFWMSIAVSTIPIFWLWQTPTSREMGWLALLGILTALYQMCLSRAYRYLRASGVGAILYSTLIFSTIYDWVIWGNEPTLYTWLGIVLVCGSSLLTIKLATRPIVPP